MIKLVIFLLCISYMTCHEVHVSLKEGHCNRYNIKNMINTIEYKLHDESILIDVYYIQNYFPDFLAKNKMEQSKIHVPYPDNKRMK